MARIFCRLMKIIIKTVFAIVLFAFMIMMFHWQGELRTSEKEVGMILPQSHHKSQKKGSK